MIGRDVFLRGRGADIGVRAPRWIDRLCGATLAVGIVGLGDLLGLWGIVGVAKWVLFALAVVLGSLVAPTAIGGLLWLISGALVSVLMLVMFTPIVRLFVPSFVRADAVSTVPVDAVVVLSGGLTDDGRIGGQAIDRLLSGLSQAKSRAISELALSVVVREDARAGASSEADQRALVQMAAPELTLRFVRDVHSTRDEALAFAALARTHGWQRVMVVTSPLHSRRACLTIEAAGLRVECRPATPRDYSLNALGRSENRRLAFQDVLYEIAAGALYRTRGWQ